MSKWSDQYKDSRWQQKRLEIMERDKFKCRSCGKEGEDACLSVHHAYYISGRKPWEYENDLLITWCDECHQKRHLQKNEILYAFSMLNHLDALSLATGLEMFAQTVAYFCDMQLSYSFDIEEVCRFISHISDLAGEE